MNNDGFGYGVHKSLRRARRIAKKLFHTSSRGIAIVTAALLVGTLGMGVARAAVSSENLYSTLSISPSPAFVSSSGGSVDFTVTVTVESGPATPVSGDSVSLVSTPSFTAPAIFTSPQVTDSNGEATFDVACAGYCLPGDTIAFSASDAFGLTLGPVTENVGLIEFAGNSYAGQTDTLLIQDLTGIATENQPVALRLNGESVTLSGCTTDGTGSLPGDGDVGACTFTVPPLLGSAAASIPAVVTVGSEAFDLNFALLATPSLSLSSSSGVGGTAVVVNGPGFAGDASVTVSFTPYGGSSSTASTSCSTDGDGNILNTVNVVCQLTIPVNATLGAGTVSAADYPTASATFTVTGSSAPVVLDVLPGELPGGTVGIAYNRTVTASGGTAPYTYSVSSGSLPTGLNLDASTGAITGTPTATGTYSFEITATDSASIPNTGSMSYTVTIAAANVALTLAPTSLEIGTVATPYDDSVVASGGTPPYTYSATGLPAWLSLNSTTGALTGTPTTPGPVDFTVTATDTSTPEQTVSLSYTIDVDSATTAAPPTLPTTPIITNLPAIGAFGGGFNAIVSTNGDGARSVTSSTTIVCTVKGLSVSYVGVGTCSLTAHVAAGTIYAAANGSVQSFTIRRGGSGVLSLSPSPLALGDVPKGQYGEPVTVTVTNLTTGPIVVGKAVAIQGTTLSNFREALAERTDFALNTCSSVTALAGGASCDFAMTFTAGKLGALSGTLAIKKSNGGSVQGSVPFTANGVQ